MRAPVVCGVVAGSLVLAASACSGSPDAASPAVASAAAATPTGSVNAPSLGTGWLAFQDSSSFRIRLVRPDGTDEHPLDAVTAGPENNPDWSPDGTRIVFVGAGTDTEGGDGLWVIGVDGNGLTELVDCSDPCLYLDDPAWSPDGSTILYSRLQPDAATGGRLEAVEVATGRTRTLLAAAPGDFYSGVRWAHDGRAAVLEEVHAPPTDYDDVTGVTLARVDLATSPPTLFPLGDDTLWPETADWSPRGDLLVYAAHPRVGADSKDLYLLRPDGTGLRRLTALSDGGGGALHPDFTDDGGAVVFLGTKDGSNSLMVVDVASGATGPAVSSGRVSGHHPRTQPTP